MATSNFVNVGMIASEALMQLENNLVAGQLMYRDKTSDFSQVGGYAVGDSVSIKTTGDFRVDEFSGSTQTQRPRDSARALTIEKHFDTTIAYTDREAALDIDSLSTQVIAPAMIAIADKMDTYLLSKAWESRGLYESLTPLTSAAEMAMANKIANKQQLSKSGRVGFVNPDLEASLLGTDTFHRFDSRATGGVNALENAMMGRIMGIDWVSSVNFTDSNYAPGNANATTDNGAGGDTNNQIGVSVLTMDAASAGAFNAGDRLQVAGIYRPLIVKTTIAVATGVTSIVLVDPIDELVPDNAAITVLGSGRSDLDFQGIIMEPNAFAMACPSLPKPHGVDSAVLSHNGLSLRVVADYNSTTKENTYSIDILCGATAYDTRKSLVIAKATA